MRSKLLVLAGVAIAGVLALIASTQAWLTLSLVQGAAAVDVLVLTGQEMNPTLSPVSVAALAAVLALTIAGRFFKYLLGVLIVGLGAGVVLIAYGILADPLNSAATPLSEITGISGDAQQSLLSATQISVWPTVTLVAGALLALMGLVVLFVSHTWAQGGRKYQSGADAAAQGEQPRGKKIARATGSAANPDRISDWEMLSGGNDPSAEAAPESASAEIDRSEKRENDAGDR